MYSLPYHISIPRIAAIRFAISPCASPSDLAKPAYASRGAAQYAGCVDGEPASRGCITVLPAGVLPTIKAVGDAITDFSYTAIYEPLSNGAYFLGELEKFVHVSPQRYASVVVGGSGACGVTATVKGTVGEQVKQACVDAAGTVHVTTATVNAAGRVAIEF